MEHDVERRFRKIVRRKKIIVKKENYNCKQRKKSENSRGERRYAVKFVCWSFVYRE